MSLGEGLFILFRIVPHEQPWLGALLSLLGGALLAFAPLPRIERLPRWPVALAGALIAGSVLGYQMLSGASWVPPKVALVGLGLALAAAAPFLARPRVAHVTAWGATLAGAPLFVWGLQAFTKTEVGGVTPMEAFLIYGLIAPMASAMTLLGMGPSVDGQVVTFATPRGPMALEVGVACSGLQAMALFSGILLVYVLAEKPEWRRGLLWSVVGILGVYVVNVIRLVVLAIVGAQWGSAALEWTHANLGWMFFVAWSGAFAWLTMGRTRPRASRPAPASRA